MKITVKRNIKANTNILSAKRINPRVKPHSGTYTYSELTEDEKKQAIDIANDSSSDLYRKISSYYDEVQYWQYLEEVRNLADILETNTGISVDTESLYWQSNSQGPYPEWKLSEVFDEYNGVVDGVDYTIKFDGSLSVEKYTYFELYINSEWIFDLEISEVQSIAPNVASVLNNKVQAAQKFIDDVWGLINDLCVYTPDDYDIISYLENCDTQFYVDEGVVEY